MNLFYFTASDIDARKHLEDTIINEYPIKNFYNSLDIKAKTDLQNEGFTQTVRMWGAVPGDQNIPRWEKIQNGDKILIYSKGKFLFSATIFGKTHNRELARAAWNMDKKGDTWEYIYFIKDLKEINIGRLEFATYFGYKPNFTPQGFSNIQGDKLEIRLRKFESIEHLVDDINNNYIISEDEFDEDNFQAGLDSDYKNINTNVNEVPQDRKEPRIENGKKVWPRDTRNAKIAIKKAYFKCEIDEAHTSFISDTSGKNYTEAHHLIPLKFQHEFIHNLDIVGNIVSLCPICHRKIHLARSKDKVQLLTKLYEDRKEQLHKYGIKISLHDLLGAYAINSK